MNSKDRGQKVLGGAVPLRFVQIVAGASGSEGEVESVLFGLDAEGQVWEYCSRVTKLKEQKELVDAAGNKLYSWWSEPVYWWQPLRMSREKGPAYEEPAA